MKYVAIIVAAGLSTNVNEVKPMLCIGEKTIISTIIDNVKAAGVDDIVVVAGYESEKLTRYLENEDVKVIKNAEYASTEMFDSICLGIRSIKKDYDGLLIIPVDIPLVKPDTIKKMLKTKADVVRPVFCGTTGHPVLISSNCIDNVLEHDGENGLKGALASIFTNKTYLNKHTLVDLEVDDMGIVMDSETSADFKALKSKAIQNRSDGELWGDIKINLVKNDTILTPETAQFVEMIYHTGSIQKACACMHISYTKGWSMLNKIEKELTYNIIERTPGGSGGGGSCLTERGMRLIEAYREYKDRIRKFADEIFDEAFEEFLHE